MRQLFFATSNLSTDVNMCAGRTSLLRNVAIASIAAFATAAAVVPSIACTTSDFEIIQADWWFNNEAKEMIVVVGEIKNNCSTPMGVEIQAVFRNATGKVVDARQFFPKGSRNMNPGETYAFKNIVLTGRVEQTITTGSVKVVGTYLWPSEQ